jgi:glycogen operon protein
LFVSLGVPMVSGGDELGRSQTGNNNAYCHDSPLTWTDWSGDASARRFLAFARRAAALRASQTALRRGAFLEGRRGETADVRWLREDGHEMIEADWNDPERRTLGMELDGTLLTIFNASASHVTFSVPPGPAWTCLLDTATPDAAPAALPASAVTVMPQSMTVLARDADAEEA